MKILVVFAIAAATTIGCLASGAVYAVLLQPSAKNTARFSF